MLKKLVDIISKRQHRFLLQDINAKVAYSHSLLVHDYLDKHLYNHSKYQSPKRLNKFEFQIFSQNGEDGIIKEIFNRIGVTNKFFIEFGVEYGVECNSTYLLHKDWKGLWIEGNKAYVEKINGSFSKKISKKELTVINAFITAENIEMLFGQGNAPVEPDLLSIDIDRNDYYVWKAITKYRPRVVIIEYNPIFRPGDHFIIDYAPTKVWDGSSNYGASLESYYELGKEKGYVLVACNFTGGNAFFIREDIAGDLFEAPYTPETHYEPPRYFLLNKDGHPRKLSL